MTSLGEFDVAIVELARGANGDGAAALTGIAAIRALRKAQPGLGIVAHGPRPERHAATEAIERRRHRLRRQELAAGGARPRRSTPPPRPRRSSTRARRSANGAERADQPPARDPAALSPTATAPQQVAKRLGLSTETVRTHTKAVARPARGPRPRPRGRDRPPQLPDRVGARASRGRGRSARPGRGRRRRSCGRRCGGGCGPCSPRATSSCGDLLVDLALGEAAQRVDLARRERARLARAAARARRRAGTRRSAR